MQAQRKKNKKRGLFMIGKKLKELIKSKHIKQIKLAKLLGISPSRLSNYLTDKREPDLDMLIKIANYLSVDLNYFADNEFNTHPNDMLKLLEQEDCVYIQRLMTNSKRLSDTDRLLAFPKLLISGLNADRLLVYEAHADISNIAKQGDYLIVEPFLRESAHNGDLILFRARNYRVATLFIKDGEYMLMHNNTNVLEKSNELHKYDIIRIVIHRL
jgi:transcriptional regulator with XRE-family HTH domain